MSAPKRPSSAAKYANLVIGLVLAAMLIIIGSQSFTQGLSGILLGVASYLAAGALIYLSVMNYYRISYYSSHIPEKTFTVLRCPTCGYQVTREFAVGDYVGKQAEACPKDGTPMLIVRIYVLPAQTQ